VGLDRDLTARTGPRIYRPRPPPADYVEFIGDWRSLHPPVAAGVPGAPRGCFVEAIKDQRPV
jgi:hypothetical protein